MDEAYGKERWVARWAAKMAVIKVWREILYSVSLGITQFVVIVYVYDPIYKQYCEDV